MSAIEPLYHVFGINPAKLSKNELLLLEAELFTEIYAGLKETFRERYRNYFHLMKFTKEMEDSMLDANFIRLIIKDILATEEYTLDGIARYTDTPKEVLYEIAIGKNSAPSATLLRKTIELHRSVRREVYLAIRKKSAPEQVSA